MTTYIQSSGSVGNFPADTLSAVELRVISNLLQSQNGAMQQDELRILRNDQAFELGISPAVIPGS
jgi:hypothetical protein